jgi:NhaA family Na+:H+ antiporter
MERDAYESLPAPPIDRLLAPIERFLHVEAAGGIVLLLCTAAALVLANSPWADAWAAIWKTPFSLGIGGFEMRHPLKHWINDGLMAIFFFVIGLEVKRELVVGELRDPRRAALPIAGALGGMLVPAAIYLWLQGSGPAAAGWGIPMATDIAFVVGCLALLGSRVPLSLRVMLLSLAIADDIGAILVIAIGYTETLDLLALALGLAGFAVIVGLARIGVRSLLVYVVAGACVWFEFHESGVHATIAGVALGLLTPAHAYASQSGVARAFERASEIFRGGRWEHVSGRAAQVRSLERVTREVISPVEYLEARLHPWVGFVIMPLFALANAGVPLDLAKLTSPVAFAVAAGLVVGKPVGIVLFAWLAIRAGVASLPREIGWDVLLGAGALAGIGFTMSLFIAGLALDGPPLDAAKIGTLTGSVVSAALGMGLLAWRLPREKSLPRSAASA